MDTVKPGVLQPVKSSNVAALGHDPETGDFYVKWVGDRLSAYANVPADIAAKVLEAKSPGTAVRSILVATYKHRYVTAEAVANG